MDSSNDFETLMDTLKNGVDNNWSAILLVLIDPTSISFLDDDYEFELALGLIPFEQRVCILNKKNNADKYKALSNKLLQLFGCGMLLDWKGSADASFTTNKFGKPSVENVSFNMSNGRNLVGMYVVNAGNVDVGIDIASFSDYNTELLNTTDVFAFEEIALFDGVAGNDLRRQLFAHLWSLKEAYIKFLGTGLSYYNALSTLNFAEELKNIYYIKDIDKNEFEKVIGGKSLTFTSYNALNNEVVSVCSENERSVDNKRPSPVVYSINIRCVIDYLDK
ncbi:hypothetical protein TPHA_0C03550 [Tetrapisispora phaffii CBS 4417]|uniref:holo-[acyl-carrier-protein] synthase n=1 Tax=Tetrapisispora phaffii (strain ATCC 24235 / CBS 4417 / NBRC 1672 / NRRL Y-8282 / UCD 70-5) TaxID=1071381 RepID=G8BQJ5_TETPH|nr:hypothetical protein TPHA_0C03550 [Tetrapisispora phaffii CBS 4417]CCE62507.1 hypothetical protein TPHA_0C03550 [Tetrapisispora phaffii CBS 4417]